MKILCIGDVHNKPAMFDRADKILESGQADRAIQMGDILDDFGQELNIALYVRTLERANQFQKDFPSTLWILSNHDQGYWYPNLGVKESGHSTLAEAAVFSLLKELERHGGVQKIMHVIDGCIFTHAGLTMDWVARHTPSDANWNNELEFVQDLANSATPQDLWEEDSPIWARPQMDGDDLYPAKLQITGHTPVKKLGIYGGCLSTDTFSTYSDGKPYGDRKFAIVDTETGEWEVAKEDETT